MEIRKYIAKNGQARFRVYVYNARIGKREYHGSFCRQQDARAAGRHAEDLLAGGFSTAKREEVPFSELVDMWLETKSASVKETTLEEYGYTSSHLTDYFGTRLISTITRHDIDRLVSFAKRQGRSDYTVRRMLTRLSQVFNIAVEWGYLDRSPPSGACTVAT